MIVADFRENIRLEVLRVRVFGVLKKMSINYTIPEKTVLAPWYR
jgi:hypothetical protein